MPITTTHPAYRHAKTAWERCRDAFAGSDAIKAKRTQYLPRTEGQTENDYAGYLSRALFYPVLSRTVSGLSGLACGKPPSVLAVPDAYRAHLDDITLSGITLAGYGVQVVSDVLTVGRCGTLVDMPEAPGSGARPYWVPYTAEQITHWRTATINGVRTLVLLVLAEDDEQPKAGDAFEVECRPQYRVLELIDNRYTVTIWRQARREPGAPFVPGESRVPLRRGVPLPFIPFVFHGPVDTTDRVTHPPLLDLVDVNLSHYRTSADRENGAHFAGMPQFWAAGVTLPPGESLYVGSGAAWVFPDPSARAGVIDASAQGIGALKELMEEKRQMMATLGARLLETQKTGTEAAETVRLRQAGDASALALLADATSRGLTQALCWHLFWAGLDEAQASAVQVTLNPDLLDRLTADEVRALVTTWQAGAISHETVYANLERGKWTRDGVTFAEEAEDIAEEEPKLATVPEQADAADSALDDDEDEGEDKPGAADDAEDGEQADGLGMRETGTAGMALKDGR